MSHSHSVSVMLWEQVFWPGDKTDMFLIPSNPCQPGTKLFVGYLFGLYKTQSAVAIIIITQKQSKFNEVIGLNHRTTAPMIVQ